MMGTHRNVCVFNIMARSMGDSQSGERIMVLDVLYGWMDGWIDAGVCVGSTNDNG